MTELGLGAGTVTDTSTPTPISCAEAGGGVPQTGICSESDAPGAMVTLTENPIGSSTFGGWGGACAGTPITSPTCTVTMSSSQNVTASFVAPPVSFQFTVNLGTNVTESALLCYGLPVYPPNPCNDPKASQLTTLIPVVITSFPLTVEVTEFYDNGFCPAGENGQTGPFACRFGSFFNYGTDPNNNTIAPLCYAYLNGNCAQYLLYKTDLGPHTAFPAGFTSGDFYLDFGFLDVSAINNLPSYWTGGTPRVLDDPDGNEFPPLPYGTDCSTAMMVNGVPTNPPIYCQFDEDVTTFFTPGASLNSPIGGKIPPTNNLVVAFLPTTTGTNPPQQPPAQTAPTIAGSCVNGCTLSSSTITFTEGTGGTFEVSITGYPAPTLTESGTLPSGLTFTASTGTISGTPADGTAGNYSISFTATNSAGPATLSYTLTVSAAPLTITASNGAMTYGGTPPTITPSYNGFVNGDTYLSLGTVTCTTTATSSSPVGSYPSSCSATDPTYAITSVPGTVTVGPAPLTIAASSATITYGGTVPPITPTFTGLVNGDNAITLGVTCTTTATNTSLPGSYPTSCTASNGTNYTITYVNGTVIVLGLDISPLTVNFGSLYLDQIGVQFVTLKNTTTAPITINSITLGGGSAPSDFGDVALCPPMILKLPATLPAGKSCAIGVGILATAKVFSPTASTTYLTITDSAATQTVLLTAQVTDPQVSLSTTSLSFGNQKTGTTSVAQKVTLTNSGLTPLTLTGLTISGNFAFATGTTCTSSTVLSPGAPCYIYVSFAPTSKGSKSGSVTITDLALFGKQTISLSGTGD